MIHSTAIVAAGAVLGDNVSIGPYSIVDANVTLADNCSVGPHVYLTGYTSIGAGTRIHAGAVIGDLPQDLHFAGGQTYVRIGANCVVRENVTVHRGTADGSSTVIGDNVMLMAVAHVAHNCTLADNVILANNVMLGGHVEIGARAFLSGGVMVHQFCRVGGMCMVGGGTRVTQDLPPYCMYVMGDIQGPNIVGMRRAGMAPAARKAIRQAIKILFYSGLSRPNAIARIRAELELVPELLQFLDFCDHSQRGIVPGGHRHGNPSGEPASAD